MRSIHYRVEAESCGCSDKPAVLTLMGEGHGPSSVKLS
jgi:hypothetical protein